MGEVTKYRYKHSHISMWLSSKGLLNNPSILGGPPSQSVDHSNTFLSTLKNGKHLFVDRETKWLGVATLPVGHCDSLGLRGDCFSMSRYLLEVGLSSSLRNLEAHKLFERHLERTLGEVQLHLVLLRTPNTSSRSDKCCFTFMLLTSMLSTYTFMFLLICCLEMARNSLCYVAPAFFNSKGITL